MCCKIENCWTLLQTKNVLVFGSECVNVTIFMFFSIAFRSIIYIIGLSNCVPHGFTFASPYIVQKLVQYFRLSEDCYPLLTVRIAEIVIGRIHASNLLLIISSHILGNIVGAAVFAAVLPASLTECGLQPIVYPPTDTTFAILYEISIEVFLSATYCTIVLVLPELLSVNKLPSYLLSIPILPLMTVGTPIVSSAFNPAAIYALWFTGSLSWRQFPLAHLIGPCVGGYIAGVICYRVFPDDPLSWKKK